MIFLTGNKPDDDDEARPPPCVGICYYNKLVALEAKEDLTRHNGVYKQVNMSFCGNMQILPANKDYQSHSQAELSCNFHVFTKMIVFNYSIIKCVTFPPI